MGNITLALPNEIHNEMKHFADVRWSEVARQAIIRKLETLRLAEKLAKKSRLTAGDVRGFDRKIKTLATKRFLA